MNRLQTTVQGYAVRTGAGAAYIPKTVQAIGILIQWRNRHADAPDYWLRQIITTAFERMIARRLPDAPAADLVEIVAEDWAEIIGDGMTMEWDCERVIAGFRRVFRECSRWPQPADLLKRLPNRPADAYRAQGAQPQQMDDDAHARAAAEFQKIIEMFGG